MTKLYADVTNITDIHRVQVSISHSASTSSAVIDCSNYGVGIGDSISVDLGYDDNHSIIFTGFVKQIEQKVPNKVYTITAKDTLIRAIDYFIVPTNPENVFKRRNILAENLVGDVLSLAGLTNYNGEITYFTLAIGVDAEVKLISAYDYCKSIADLLAYHLYADVDGQIHFKNRKPFVMKEGDPQWPGYQQPGNSTDVPIGTIDDSMILSLNYKKVETNLRNRIVVWGKEGVFAEAKKSTSFDPILESWIQVTPTTPSIFYKTIAFVSSLVGTDNLAQSAADYNLTLFNRLGYGITMSVVGDPSYIARNTITINDGILGIDKKDFYIFLSEHSWSKSGYVVNMELNR